jgi:hypothetical protein
MEAIGAEFPEIHQISADQRASHVSDADDTELKDDDQQIDEQNNNSRKGPASGKNLIAIAA